MDDRARGRRLLVQDCECHDSVVFNWKEIVATITTRFVLVVNHTKNNLRNFWILNF